MEQPKLLAVRRKWFKAVVGLVVVGLVVLAGLAYGRSRRPEPTAPWLVGLEPADRATVGSIAPVTVRLRATRSAEEVQQAVTFTPTVAGQWHAEEQGRVWRFVPAPPGWPKGGTVQVHLAPPLVTTAETHLFHIRPLLLAYLWPQAATAQVYALEPHASATEQRALTQAPRGVAAFAVAPSGERLVYSAYNEQGGADVWLMDLTRDTVEMIVRCGPDFCDQPRLARDGRLAWVREPRRGPRRIEVWDPRRALRWAPESQGETYGPLWSATGWLAYYDAADRAYHLRSPDGHEILRVPNETGEHAAWGPQGQNFYHVELYEVPAEITDIADPRWSAHVLRFDLARQTQTDLTHDWHWEDALPAPDPTGRYLAFARKDLRIAAWTPGRQAWLYDLQTGTARPLSQDAAYNHLDFAWSPDGQILVYVRTPQLDLSASPELWLYDMRTHTASRLLEGAYAPQWIP